MDAKSLKYHDGTLLAYRRGDTVRPARLMDNYPWWQDSAVPARANFGMVIGSVRVAARQYEKTGYPALTLYGANSMTAKKRAAAEKWLAETNLTVDDLISTQGRRISRELPEGIIFRVINPKDLFYGYNETATEVAAALETEKLKAYEAKSRRQAFIAEVDGMCQAINEQGINVVSSSRVPVMPCSSPSRVRVDIGVMRYLMSTFVESSKWCYLCAKKAGSDNVPYMGQDRRAGMICSSCLEALG